MVSVVPHQADISHFCPHLDGCGTTLHFEVLHHDHGVAVFENVARGIANHRKRVTGVVRCFIRRPFVRTFRAHQEIIHLIGIDTRTLRARGQIAHPPPYPFGSMDFRVSYSENVRPSKAPLVRHASRYSKKAMGPPGCPELFNCSLRPMGLPSLL